MDTHLAAFGKLTEDIVVQTQALLEDSKDFASSAPSQSTGNGIKRELNGGFWRNGNYPKCTQI
jgi:hypothetical protein